jgi:cyclic pyranopterin phosphate synthase
MAKMIDVTRKKPTIREAIVNAKVFIKHKVIKLIKGGKIPKGNVLQVAKLAGIMAAKRTHFLIPLCHPIPIGYIDIDFLIKERHIEITTTVKGEAKTGVEMEAFTATTIAALTIYDMCKSIDREITISEIKLIKKSGGRSGTYVR